MPSCARCLEAEGVCTVYALRVPAPDRRAYLPNGKKKILVVCFGCAQLIVGRSWSEPKSGRAASEMAESAGAARMLQSALPEE